jgi:iron complex outermembrane recepter protein
MDLRLAWRPRKRLELAMVGQNLLQNHHLEYAESAASGSGIEVPRGVYGTLTWNR